MKPCSFSVWVVLVSLLLLPGCGVSRIGPALTSSLLDQPDPQLVADGAPSYLLVTDALIAADPDDAERLSQGALLYSFYGATFVADETRSRTLAARARGYAERALCEENELWCGLTRVPLDQFERRLGAIDADELPLLYSASVSWLYDIKSNSGDWAALADLPKVELLLSRLLAIDETYEHGSLHFYLGLLKTLRPQSLGGDPDGGRDHLLRAIEISAGRDLGFRVELAASYARLIYDRELHDKTLQEVLAADVEAPGLTLSNVLAKRRAAALLQSANDYF